MTCNSGPMDALHMIQCSAIPLILALFAAESLLPRGRSMIAP